MRLLLDTDVVVAAMRSLKGASAAILRAARQGRTTLLLSVALALEYESVCGRAEHRLASGLSLGEVARDVGVGAPTLLRWETGERTPRLSPEVLAYGRLLDRLATKRARAREPDWRALLEAAHKLRLLVRSLPR